MQRPAWLIYWPFSAPRGKLACPQAGKSSTDSVKTIKEFRAKLKEDAKQKDAKQKAETDDLDKRAK